MNKPKDRNRSLEKLRYFVVFLQEIRAYYHNEAMTLCNNEFANCDVIVIIFDTIVVVQSYHRFQMDVCQPAIFLQCAIIAM